MNSFSLPSKPSAQPSFLKPQNTPKPPSATSRIAEQLGELQESAMKLALPMSAHVRRSQNGAPQSTTEKSRPVNPFEATVKSLGTSVIEKNEDRFAQAAQEMLLKQQTGEQSLFNEAIKKAQEESNRERDDLLRKANVSQSFQFANSAANGASTDVMEKLNALKKQLENENIGIQSKVQQGNAKISQSMSGLADQAALAGQLKEQLQKWEMVAAQVDTFTSTTDKLANIGEMFKDGLETIHSLGDEPTEEINRFPHSSFLDSTTLSWCRESESRRSLNENKVMVSQEEKGLDAVDLSSHQNTVYWLGSALNKQINKMSVKVMKVEEGKVLQTFVFPKESYAKRIVVVKEALYILSSIKEKKTLISSLTKLHRSDLTVDATFGSNGSMFFSSDLFENSMSVQMSVDSTQTKMAVLARAPEKVNLRVQSVLTLVTLEKGVIESSSVIDFGEGETLITDMCFTSENDIVMVGIQLSNSHDSKPFLVYYKNGHVTGKQDLPSDFFPKKVMDTHLDYKVLVLTHTNGYVLSLNKTTLAVTKSANVVLGEHFIKTVPENWFWDNTRKKLTVVGSIQKTDSKKSSDSFVMTLDADEKIVCWPVHLGGGFYQSLNALTQLQDGKMMYNGIYDQTSSSQSRVGLLVEM